MAVETVFFGTSSFAVPILQALTRDERFVIGLVVTQPDRPAGRGRRLAAPPVKEAAQSLGLPVWQPETLRAAESQERLQAARADLYVVAAYGELLPRAVLRLPRHGAVNVHPSLLPAYRGASPVQAAILAGERTTGVTFIRMTVRMDAGPIIAQFPLEIEPRETAGELSERLAALAARQAPEVLWRYVQGELVPVPQDESRATYTRPLTKDSGRIDWSQSAEQVDRLVRAMQPWPRAWTLVDGRRLVVLDVGLPEVEVSVAPGHIQIHGDRVLVGTGTRPVSLERVLPEGRKPLSGSEWWRGARLSPCTKLT